MQTNELVMAIQLLCEEYLGYLRHYENECSYTDCVVEKIIERADDLKEKYYEEN